MRANPFGISDMISVLAAQLNLSVAGQGSCNQAFCFLCMCIAVFPRLLSFEHLCGFHGVHLLLDRATRFALQQEVCTLADECFHSAPWWLLHME